VIAAGDSRQGVKDSHRKETIRVFLIFDSATILRSLRELLADAQGIEIIGEAREPFKALQAIRTLKPHAVIVGSRSRRSLGVDIIRGLNGLSPAPKIVALDPMAYSAVVKIPTDWVVDVSLEGFAEWQRVPEILKSLSLR